MEVRTLKETDDIYETIAKCRIQMCPVFQPMLDELSQKLMTFIRSSDNERTKYFWQETKLSRLIWHLFKSPLPPSQVFQVEKIDVQHIQLMFQKFCNSYPDCKEHTNVLLELLDSLAKDDGSSYFIETITSSKMNNNVMVLNTQIQKSASDYCKKYGIPGIHFFTKSELLHKKNLHILFAYYPISILNKVFFQFRLCLKYQCTIIPFWKIMCQDK